MVKVDGAFFELFVEPGGVVKEEFRREDGAAVAIEEAHFGERVLFGQKLFDADENPNELGLLGFGQLIGGGAVNFSGEAAEVGEIRFLLAAKRGQTGFDVGRAEIGLRPPGNCERDGFAKGVLGFSEAGFVGDVDAVLAGEVRLEWRGLHGFKIAKVGVDAFERGLDEVRIRRATAVEVGEQVAEVRRDCGEWRPDDFRDDVADGFRDGFSLFQRQKVMETGDQVTENGWIEVGQCEEAERRLGGDDQMFKILIATEGRAPGGFAEKVFEGDFVATGESDLPVTEDGPMLDDVLKDGDEPLLGSGKRLGFWRWSILPGSERLPQRIYMAGQVLRAGRCRNVQAFKERKPAVPVFAVEFFAWGDGEVAQDFADHLAIVDVELRALRQDVVASGYEWGRAQG